MIDDHDSFKIIDEFPYNYEKKIYFGLPYRYYYFDFIRILFSAGGVWA